MKQTEHITESCKGKHLCFEERLKIEALKRLDTPLSKQEIVKHLGRASQTIHTEIKDGTVRQIQRRCGYKISLLHHWISRPVKS